MCQFIPFYAWRCTLDAVSAHGWLTWTDVRDVRVLPLTRERLRRICAHHRVLTHMQHLMPQCILCMCVYIIASACREARNTENNLTEYKHLMYTYAIPMSKDMLLCASLELPCILKVLWPWAFAICSVTFTDRIRGQMAVLKWKWVCSYSKCKLRVIQYYLKPQALYSTLYSVYCAVIDMCVVTLTVL